MTKRDISQGEESVPTLASNPSDTSSERSDTSPSSNSENSNSFREQGEPERMVESSVIDPTKPTNHGGRGDLRAAKMEKYKKSGSKRSIANMTSETFKYMKSMVGLQDTASYDKLIEDDAIRQKTASFIDQPFYRIIFHYQGTVWTVIFGDLLFWITLAIYTAIRVKIHFGEDFEGTENMKNLSSNLVYVGGFLLFFLVFFVNQNNNRYFDLHRQSMVLMGRVNDVATMVKSCLPMERARRIVRYMNAAHVCVYTGLSEHYEKENFFDPLNQRFSLLTDEEEERIADEINVDTGPKAVFELITWAMMDVRSAQEENLLSDIDAFQLREQMLTFRSHVAKIFVTCTLPIPFFYVHFLSILTGVYLPLFAITIAIQTGGKDVGYDQELISGLVVFLQALFTIGLRILGQQLSDPYGDDMIDLQIARYVIMICTGSNQILQAKRPPAPSKSTESVLKKKMAPIGQAYEYASDEEVSDQF